MQTLVRHTLLVDVADLRPRFELDRHQHPAVAVPLKLIQLFVVLRKLGGRENLDRNRISSEKASKCWKTVLLTNHSGGYPFTPFATDILEHRCVCLTWLEGAVGGKAMRGTIQQQIKEVFYDC